MERSTRYARLAVFVAVALACLLAAGAVVRFAATERAETDAPSSDSAGGAGAPAADAGPGGSGSDGLPSPVSLVERYMAALSAGDAAALATLYATDEPAAPDRAARTALGRSGGARIVSYSFDASATRAVRAGDNVVYWLYVQMEVDGGGLSYSRTLLVPARLIDGAWRASSFDERTDGLQSLGATALAR